MSARGGPYLDGSKYGPGAVDEDGQNWTQFLDDRAAGYGMGPAPGVDGPCCGDPQPSDPTPDDHQAGDQW